MTEGMKWGYGTAFLLLVMAFVFAMSTGFKTGGWGDGKFIDIKPEDAFRTLLIVVLLLIVSNVILFCRVLSTESALNRRRQQAGDVLD